MVKLKHLGVLDLVNARVFDSVKSYDDMTQAIDDYGRAGGEPGSEAYNDRVGTSFEVYAEFWLTRFGTSSNAALGITSVAHTSQNKYQIGYDFTYHDLSKKPGRIQVKYRSNPLYTFGVAELGTFVSMCDGEGVPRTHRVLFTNLDHRPSDSNHGVFSVQYHFGRNQMRVLSRIEQEALIDRDPVFWNDFIECLKLSAQAPKVAASPPMRVYQVEACDAALTVDVRQRKRGKVIMATGGGKTLVQYELIRTHFVTNRARLQIIVAPKIDLLRQHYEKFASYGLFHRDGVACVDFRTGDESREDAHVSYCKTTQAEKLLEFLAQVADKQVLVFVTYASVEKLLSLLAKVEREVYACVWDEFHYLAIQTIKQRDWLKALWPTRNVFFSASEKRGRIVSTLDEELFGPKLSDVAHVRLRGLAVLVPKIVIKPIKLDEKGRVKAISREMKKAAEREGFDLKDASLEAAACIVAHHDMLATFGHANGLTFSKQVAMCKAIVSSVAVSDELPNTLIQTVHAEVPSRERKEAYDRVRTSTDSLMCQYGIVKEGTDITALDYVVLSRNMDVIGVQQALGRILRADPRDTEAFKAGRINLDSPDGWHKHTATVYVVVDDEDADGFRRWLKGFVYSLQTAGLGPDDYQFADISEERHGITRDETGWIVPLVTKAEVGADALKSLVSKLRVEQEEEDLYEADYNAASKRPTLELL